MSREGCGTKWVVSAKGNAGRGDFRRPSREMDILPFHLDVGHFLVMPHQAAVIRVPEAVDL